MQSQLVPKVKVRGVVKRQKASSGRNYLRTLDQELILKCQEESEGPEAAARDLQAVGRISLSEQRIGRLDEEAILSCVRLRICNLGGCYLEDIRAFYGSVNLLKLDLSNNQASHSHQCRGKSFSMATRAVALIEINFSWASLVTSYRIAYCP